jgi:xanthine dehydrogenase accessory factor
MRRGRRPKRSPKRPQGAPLVVTLDLSEEVLGVGMPWGGKRDAFIEPVLPKPELLIAGHGRIAENLAILGHLLGFSITVNDPAAEPSAFPQVERVLAKDSDLSQTPVGGNTFAVIATQHKNDHLWLHKALAGDAKYVALIASQHRARLVLDYLSVEGIPEEKLAKISAPAGLDLGATTPEEIALSIMSQSQIVALRRGGTLKPLSLRDNALSSPSQSDHRLITQCDTSESR